ncbi:MAG TPA: hypothetical protein DHV36_08050 [Desulfobacteraceae bacterium]|nr:hypothetical protein [Desulfobacteraceae bacterium]
MVFICFFVNPAYSENAPDESSIFQLFDDMETAWNAEDAPSYMNFFHKSVKLKLGKPGNVKYFTWDEYAKVLPERMKKFGPFKMVNPKVLKLDGESAKAKVIVRKKSRDYTNVFNMIWEDNRWQITSNEW